MRLQALYGVNSLDTQGHMLQEMHCFMLQHRVCALTLASVNFDVSASRLQTNYAALCRKQACTLLGSTAAYNMPEGVPPWLVSKQVSFF